jgi:hypothetical protein
MLSLCKGLLTSAVVLSLPGAAFAQPKTDAGSGPTTGATSQNDAGSGPTKGAQPNSDSTGSNSRPDVTPGRSQPEALSPSRQ